MSIRIHSGFVVDTIDAASLAERISAFRTSLAPERLRAHARLLAERTCGIVDRTIVFDKVWDRSPLSKAFHDIDDAGRESDARGTRAVFEDFGMSLSLIPDSATGRTYGVVHCERADWRRRWMRSPGVEDFHYQDSADRRSGISASAWRTRRDTWARVMPTYVPDEHGFKATVFPTRVVTAHRRPLSFQPTHATRVMSMAHEMVMNERMADVDPGNVVQALMRQSAHLRTAEGQALLQERAASIMLPRRLTWDIAASRHRPEPDVLDMAGVRTGLDGELDARLPSR